jgi:RNA polymerase sigma-70 factor (ECF subfamily)
MIKRILAGEKELFANLYENNRRQVFLIAFRMCQSRPDAEEVVSEVFLKAYRGLHKFKGDSSLATWLYRIAVNESNNLLRQTRRQAPWSLEMDDAAVRIEEELVSRDQVRALREAMSDLSPQDRLILTLRYDNELSYQEIAEIIQMPKNSVGTRIARAKKTLTERMKEGG